MTPVLARALASLEDYEILEEIASGGMGVVFKARQKSLNRVVALKAMKPEILVSGENRQRFHREAETVAGLNHPAIVTIYDAGQVEGLDYFVMEYIEGRTLSQYIEEEAPPLRDRLTLFSRICEAVHFAHEHDIVHRDLKPSNIMVTPDGDPRILDFGLARLRNQEETSVRRSLATLPGIILGTFAYMSPEQTLGRPEEVDAPSDVYSLGVILYEMLTGALPYALKGHLVRILYVIRQSPPKAPSAIERTLKGEVEVMILKALDKEKERRYETAQAFAEDIDRWLRGVPVLARRASRAYRLWRFVLRHKAVSGAAAAAILALVVFSGLYLGDVLRARAVRRRAVAREAEAERARDVADIEAYRTALANTPGLVKEGSAEAHKILDRYPPTWEAGWIRYQADLQCPWRRLGRGIPLAWSRDGTKVAVWERKREAQVVRIVDVATEETLESFTLPGQKRRRTLLPPRSSGSSRKPTGVWGLQGDLLVLTSAEVFYKPAHGPARRLMYPEGDLSRTDRVGPMRHPGRPTRAGARPVRASTNAVCTPDGEFVWAGRGSGTTSVSLFRYRPTRTPSPLEEEPLAIGGIIAGVFSPDGRLLAVQRSVLRPDPTRAGHPGARTRPVTRSTTIKIHDVASQKQIAQIEAPVEHFCWTGDSQYLVTGPAVDREDRRLKILAWSRKDGAWWLGNLPSRRSVVAMSGARGHQLVWLEEITPREGTAANAHRPLVADLRALLDRRCRDTDDTASLVSFGRGYSPGRGQPGEWTRLVVQPDGNRFCFSTWVWTGLRRTRSGHECQIWRTAPPVTATVGRRHELLYPGAEWETMEVVGAPHPWAIRPAYHPGKGPRLFFSAADGRLVADPGAYAEPRSAAEQICWPDGTSVWLSQNRMWVRRGWHGDVNTVDLGREGDRITLSKDADLHAASGLVAVAFRRAGFSRQCWAATVRAETGTVTAPTLLDDTKTSALPKIRWTASGQQLWIAPRSAEAYWLDVRTKQRVDVHRPAGEDWRSALSGDGEFVAYTNLRGGKVQIAGLPWGDRMVTIPDEWVRVIWNTTGHLAALVDRPRSRLAIWNPDVEDLVHRPMEIDVRNLGWNPAGGLLIVRSRQDRLILIDGESGERVDLTSQAGGMPRASDWSADGARVGIPLADGSIDVWDVRKRTSLLTLQAPPAGERARPTSRLTWAPDGQRLIVETGETFRLVSVPSGEIVAEMRGASWNWNPSGDRFLIAIERGALVGRRDGALTFGLGRFAGETAFVCAGPKADYVVSASRAGGLRCDRLEDDAGASLAYRQFNQVFGLFPRNGDVFALVKEGAGYRLVSATGAAKPIDATPVPPARIAAAVSLSNGERLALVLDSGTIWLLDAKTGEGAPLQMPPVSAGTRRGAAETPTLVDSDNRRTVLIAAPGETSVQVLDVGSRSISSLEVAGTAGRVTAVALSGDGRTAALAFAGGRLELWNVAEKRLGRVLQERGARIDAMALSSDGGRLFAVAQDPAVHIWDTLYGAVVMTIPMKVTVRSISLSGDNRDLVVSGEGRTVLFRSSFPAGRVESYAVKPEPLEHQK